MLMWENALDCDEIFWMSMVLGCDVKMLCELKSNDKAYNKSIIQNAITYIPIQQYKIHMYAWARENVEIIQLVFVNIRMLTWGNLSVCDERQECIGVCVKINDGMMWVELGLWGVI